jgi:hypothetical protein
VPQRFSLYVFGQCKVCRKKVKGWRKAKG